MLSFSRFDDTRDEIALIHDVFEKTNRSIDFKPYPSLRYVDPDPVFQAIRDSKNVNLIGTHLDLRYDRGLPPDYS